ncbi:MAG: 30S ribosomal protein S12 methylthiotransferase RimO [Bdellovibrionales bacterium]
MKDVVENNKKFHIVSLGCPKNLVDSEMMLGKLSKDGYSHTDNAETADTIIVNTCSFIEDSRKESVETIMEMAALKDSDKNKKIVVTGCLPQRYKDDLADSLPEADIVIGSGEFQNITEILKESDEKPGQQIRHYHLPTYLQTEETPRISSGPRHSAYLKISEGCKKRCAFCAIPKIRGNLQSRSLDGVISEAKLLVGSGAKEIIVISHDFTDYGWDLARKDDTRRESPYQLLKELSEVEGLDWIRVLYLYPDGIDEKLIQLFKEKKNLLPYFDMPLQHINNEVLKRMNRKMTKQEIQVALNLIRKELPEAVIRTQFIVGFPGETEEQFEELLDFVEETRFDRVGCFMYSPEESTAGGRMTDQLDQDTKQDRHDRLMALQKDISNEMHQRFVGKILDVIIEGVSEESELLLQGRMTGQAPEIDGVVYINQGTAAVGEIIKVKITDSHDYDLVGEIQQDQIQL